MPGEPDVGDGAPAGPEAGAPATPPERHGRRYTARQVFFWSVLAAFVAVGVRLHWEGSVIAAGAVLWGLATHIFGALFALALGWLAAFPIAGPLIVKALTWPLFLLINGAAFFTSLVGINIGKGRQVFEARVAATILMTGVLIGFILGKVF
ncbi:MAG TPA: hypothetical protein VI078_14535 [bacterium]